MPNFLEKGWFQSYFLVTFVLSSLLILPFWVIEIRNMISETEKKWVLAIFKDFLNSFNLHTHCAQEPISQDWHLTYIVLHILPLTWNCFSLNFHITCNVWRLNGPYSLPVSGHNAYAQGWLCVYLHLTCNDLHITCTDLQRHDRKNLLFNGLYSSPVSWHNACA